VDGPLRAGESSSGSRRLGGLPQRHNLFGVEGQNPCQVSYMLRYPAGASVRSARRERASMSCMGGRVSQGGIEPRAICVSAVRMLIRL
jgi:hypothetical protein